VPAVVVTYGAATELAYAGTAGAVTAGAFDGGTTAAAAAAEPGHEVSVTVTVTVGWDWSPPVQVTSTVSTYSPPAATRAARPLRMTALENFIL